MIRHALDVLSSDWFWLPPNVTWIDITNGPDKNIVFTEIWDIWYQIPFTLFIMALRVCMTKLMFVPLGKAFGVAERKVRIINSHVLESAYKSSHKHKNISVLAKKTDMTERQVERWFRLRHKQNKPSKLAKFCETSWKTTFLCTSAVFGLYNVLDKEWFWDIEKVWLTHLQESLTPAEWWYYTLNTSFYWSLLISHFTEVRRKDFWQMFVHHIVTIALLIITWRANICKLGMAILPLQDSSEMLLQLSKTVNYANLQVTSYIAFGFFVAWWTVVRLYIYPVKFCWVLLTSVHKVYGLIPIAVIGIAALFVIMLLQLWWSWLVILTIYNVLVIKSEHDVRSSESEISESGQEEDVD